MRERRKTGSSGHDVRLSRGLEVLFVVVIVLELLAPFVSKTLGLDGRLQLNMIVEYNKLRLLGIFVPTWIPTAFYHFGATTFYFYPPCMFYLAAVLDRIGLHSPMTLFEAISLLVTLGSFFSARWLLRSLGSTGYRLNLGAALYAFAPLRIAELYMRSSIATHITYVFLPLICGALIAIVKGEGRFASKRILLLGLACSLTALTDVPIAVMVAISAIIVTFTIWRKLTGRAVLEILIALTISALLAAYHFGSVLSAQAFSRLRDLHFSHKPEDIELYFHLGPGTYHMLLLYGASAIIAFGYLWVRWKSKPISETEAWIGRVGLPIAGFILFLDLFPLSAIVWNHFSPLDLVQFPWRFYPLMLLFGTLIVGLAQTPIVERIAKWVTAVWVLGAILPIVLVVFSMHIFAPFERPLEDATEYLPIYFNPPVPEHGGGIREAVDRMIGPHASDSAAIGIFSNTESIRSTLEAPYLEEFKVMFEKSDAVTFHRFYWPFWHLYVNGSEIPSRPDSLGRATATLPAGRYRATWKLERTPLETAGLWISGFAWSGIIVYGGIGFVRNRVRRKDRLTP